MNRIRRIAAVVALVVLMAGPLGLARAAPLETGRWVAIGPAPTVNGSTDYTEPASGRLTGIAAHPTDANIIYIAAAGGGVWKTTTGGATWSPLTDTQSTLFMGAIALAPSNPDVIYAGTGEANMGPSKAREVRDNIYYGLGVLKSTDAGRTWTLLGSQHFARRTISKIVVDPADPNIVYAAVGALATNGLAGNTGIWKSIDGGQIWTNTTGVISTTAAFSDIVMDPTDQRMLYAGVGAPGGDPANGVYKTTDAGRSWSRAAGFAGDPRIGRIALAISSKTSAGGRRWLYAALASTGPPHAPANSLYELRRTSDGGNRWEPLLTVANKFCPSAGTTVNYLAGAGDYQNVLVVDPANPGSVYAAGICMIRSVNGGVSWDLAAIAPGTTHGPHRDHHAMAFDAIGRLLDGNDGGIWRLDDPRAGVWSNLNGNLQITQFVGIARHPTDPSVAYGGTQDTGVVKFQGEVQWRRLLRGDGGAGVVSSADPMRVYYVTRISSTTPVLRRSDDGGRRWVASAPRIPDGDRMNFYFPLVTRPASADHLLMGTTRLFETVDGGRTWMTIGAPGGGGWPSCDSCNPIDSIAVAPSDPDTIYVSAGGHILVTRTHGIRWQQHDIAGGTNPHFRSLLVDPTNPLIAYAARDRFGGGHVFRTIDAGQSWTDISGDLPDFPANALVLDGYAVPKSLYAGTDVGVYASTERGGHWTRWERRCPTRRWWSCSYTAPSACSHARPRRVGDSAQAIKSKRRQLLFDSYLPRFVAESTKRRGRSRFLRQPCLCCRRQTP